VGKFDGIKLIFFILTFIKILFFKVLDDVDCFESEQDIVENDGIYLADCCHAKQVCLNSECIFVIARNIIIEFQIDIEDFCGFL